MTENDREWFNGCYVYFRILNKINELLLKIISDNMELQPEENEDYENIINKYSDILIKILKIRNKFIHEPHNIKWAYTVGGKTSCRTKESSVYRKCVKI